jgi:hypothetical protein
MPRPFGEVNKFIDEVSAKGTSIDLNKEQRSLSVLAPNVIEWVTGLDYWNVSSTFEHYRQYQILRDVFNLRCRICNSSDPEAVDCWGKSRSYLESEALLVWSEQYQDFVCPKCGTTQKEFFVDGLMSPFIEMIIIAGMRSGKSYLGAHVGGYFEHVCSALAIRGKNYLQRYLKQEKAEWFECTFAASTATQASQTIYAKYREMRNNSPWISRYITWVKEQERVQIGQGKDNWSYRVNDDAILDGWAKVRYNRVASDSAGVAGKTRIMASLDEWARLKDTEGTQSATELYRVLSQSLKTVRAAQVLSGLPAFFGLMINVTSPISQDDPAMLTYNQAANGELKKTYGWKGPTWKFNPFLPRELFDEEYAKDPIGAERDFGANPPNAATPYVDDPLRFWKCIEWDRRPIATFTEKFLTDKTGKSYVAADVANCKLDPRNTYYLFADAGVSWDAFSLVCAHPEWVDAKDSAEDGGKTLDENRPPPRSGRIEPEADVVWPEDLGTFIVPNVGQSNFFEQSNLPRTGRIQPYGSNMDPHGGMMLCTVYDFLLRIVPARGRDVWFNSVIDIVQTLSRNIRIGSVWFDHWGSHASLQQIRDMGVPSDQVTLRAEHFMGFLQMAYNGRVRMLPPRDEDHISITKTGALVLGTAQETMAGETIGLVELMRLSRSADLRKFTNPLKGTIRGRDSDDVARCIVGAHYVVQDTIVDELANTKKKRNIRKRQFTATDFDIGHVVPGRRV